MGQQKGSLTRGMYRFRLVYCLKHVSCGRRCYEQASLKFVISSTKCAGSCQGSSCSIERSMRIIVATFHNSKANLVLPHKPVDLGLLRV